MISENGVSGLRRHTRFGKFHSGRFWLEISVAFALAVGGPAAANAAFFSSGKKAVSNYQAALANLAKGQDQAAVLHLKDELRAHPANVTVRLLLGKIYLRQLQGLAAEHEFQTARLYGADADLVTPYLGRAYLLENLPQRLLDEVLPGKRSSGVEAEIQLLRGQAYVQLDQLSDAEDAYARAIELNPGQVDAYIGLAKLRADQNRFADALAYVDQAKAQDPGSVSALVVEGDVQRQAGDLAAAESSYDKALGLEPKRTDIRLNRASIRLDQHNYAAARQDIEAVLAVAPHNPYANYMLSVILQATGDKTGAKAALADVVVALKYITPDRPGSDPDLIMLAGLVAYQRGNATDTNKYLIRYIALAPHDEGMRRLLASNQIKMGLYLEAVDNLKNILLALPNDAASLDLLGQAYGGMQDASHAVDSFRQLVALQPKNAGAHFSLGKAYQAKGDDTAALGEYGLAATLDPHLKAARFLLVSLNLEIGNNAEALQASSGILTDFPDDPMALNLTAKAAQQNGLVAAAKKNYALAIAKKPAFIPAYLDLAELHLGLREYTAAADLYQAVLKRSPKNQAAYLGLGRVAEARKNLPEANGWYERARLADPANPAPWSSLINLRLQAGDYKAAISLAQDYTLKYPDNYDIKKALGLALVKANKLTEAVQTYEELVEISPDRARAFYDLAVVRQSAGNSEGARQSLSNAIAWNGKFVEAYSALIQLDITAGDLKSAASLGKQLKVVSPKLAYGALGLGYFVSRRYDLAEQAYRSGLGVDPGDWGMTLGLYQSCLKLGRTASAFSLMEGWRKDHPKDQAAGLLLASAYVQAGQPAKAIPLYEELAALQPANAALLHDLAWAYYLVRDERAVNIAEKAFHLDPRSPAIADTFAWILLKHGQAGRAVSLLQQAKARDAANPTIIYHLAAALEAAGRTNDARAELDKAFRMSDNFTGADEARIMRKRLAAR